MQILYPFSVDLMQYGWIFIIFFRIVGGYSSGVNFVLSSIGLAVEDSLAMT